MDMRYCLKGRKKSLIENIDVKTSRDIISGARYNYHPAATIYSGFPSYPLTTTYYAYVAFKRLLLETHSYLVSSLVPRQQLP